MAQDALLEVTAAVDKIPSINREQMLEIERALKEDLGIDIGKLMENAGNNLAELAAKRFCDGTVKGKTVICMVGVGLNGGGALSCANQLTRMGADVEVLVSAEESLFTGPPKKQLEEARKRMIPIRGVDGLEEQAATTRHISVIIDGIIGYHLRGAPRDAAAKLIQWANSQPAPILSLDTPTGLELSGGYVHSPAIHATATMTVALPKEGLFVKAAERFVGEIYLADIGVPEELYPKPPLYLKVPPIFGDSKIVRLR